jgi:hypothetical protein
MFFFEDAHRLRADGRGALARRYLGQNVFVQLEHLAVQRKHRRAAEGIPARHSSLGVGWNVNLDCQ